MTCPPDNSTSWNFLSPFLSLLLLPLLLLVACRAAERTVSTTGKVAIKSVSVAGRTSASAVSTAGKVAGTTVSVSGSTAKSVAGSLATPVRQGFVTFKDLTLGVSKQVPWTDGMRLYAASKTAQFDMSLKAFHILRGSQVIKPDDTQIKAGMADPELKPGDRIELWRMDP